MILDLFIKIIHHKLVQITINATGHPKIFIHKIIRHYSLLDSIISNQISVFISNCFLFICYFREIKQKLSAVLNLQIDSENEIQNSIMNAYLQTFINYKSNQQIKIIQIAEFIYNNRKNTSTNSTAFK